MSGLSMFLKGNKKQRQNTKYAASKSFCGEDGKPLEWEVRALSTKESEKIREDCTVDVPVAGKPGQYRSKMLSAKYIAKIMAAAVVFPDLQNAELQDSYGVATPEELIVEMLDNPVEYNEFGVFVQQFSGLDVTLEEKVEEAKN